MREFRQIPAVLVVTEGYTEKTFLNHLRERNMGCSLTVMKSPEANPRKLIGYTVSQIRNKGIELRRGDRAFCVFDTDYTSQEDLEKASAQAAKHGIGLIVSKPCFETVFLAHFGYDLSLLRSPADAQSALEKFIPDYSKTGDYWNLLIGKRGVAERILRGCDTAVRLRKADNGSNLFELFDAIEEYRHR
ncbi:hypothetical protein AUQ37_08825 [Candidatus Methanomethylophilus sp. 1R26]|nr:hypothetical protein AUQ37_08825 [Candidatus Methanomethylophilus sp. 1R26]